MIWALMELLVERMPYQALFDWYEAETGPLRAAET
jgi:hypothetical protein